MSKKAGVKSALAQLRENRDGGKKRTDQYEVHEASAIIEEVEEGEYDRVRRERAGNDFVVDDDGYGYADDGGEMWDDNQLYSDQEDLGDDIDMSNVPGGRAKKLRAQAMRDKLGQRKGGALPAFREKGQKSLNTFMATTGNKAGNSGGQVSSSFGVKTSSANASTNLDDLMKEFEEGLDEEKEDEPVPQRARVLAQTKRESAYAPEVVSKRTKNDDDHFDEFVSEDVRDDSLPELVPHVNVPKSVEVAAPSSMSNILTSVQWTGDVEEEPSVVEVVDVKDAEMAVEDENRSSSPINRLMVNEPGIDFYLLDVYEDFNNGSVLLFGRVRNTSGTSSCCIVVKNINRNVFFLHKNATESDDVLARQNSMEIFKEFDSLRKSGKKPFSDIKEFKVPKQLVRRNYAFELPGVPHGLLNFFKIAYNSKYPTLPTDLRGETFSRIFGATTSLAELLLVKCKVMGPSWLRVCGAVLQERKSRSWCKEEYILDFGGLKSKTFKPILPILENVPEPPRLSVLGMCVKSVPGVNSREIAAIAMCFAPAVKLECMEKEIRFDGQNGKFCAIKQFEGKILPRRELEEIQKCGIQVMDEKPMLALLCAKMQQLDPDVIIAHNAFGNELDVLANRMGYFGLKGWHRMSRLQRNDEPYPPKMKGAGSSQWPGRQFTIGRLVCDTYLSARELMRESNYELGHLAQVVLGTTRQPHPLAGALVSESAENILRKCAGSVDGMKAIADHTLCDALLSVQIAWRLQVLPLTRQLSNLAGNLWINSLLNKRAERNEWLLVHEFKKLKYIVPDKQAWGSGRAGHAAGMFDEAGGEDDEVAAVGTFKRKKAGAYLGGLVLEPKAGLYDKLVLLLDFNSLYPSIIREYNICFTTVARLDGEAASKAETMEEVIPPHPPRGMEDGVLPRVITRLVNSRKTVKRMIKSERVESVKLMLDIRQKALKLTANSLYGCLGFSSSRFYAKPIASLITWTGRQTLQATVDLVEKNLRLDVIYGDTDSIFVHTGQDDFSAAVAIGSEIAKEVNKQYSKLEIEMECVFRSLLLLKKKKYACLKVRDWDKQLFDREEKGLDMVRRDWCVMSKRIGGDILDQLLNPARTKEETLIWLQEYLQTVGRNMCNGNFDLSEYVITKGITKMPDDYPDAKNQPHVLVAKRRIEAGERVRPGNEIPYIVTQMGEDEQLSVAERARSPEEATRLGLLPDIAWYKSQQIHPPISRLCAPTGVADSARIAEWLGLDPTKFATREEGLDGPLDEGIDGSNLDDALVDVDIRFKDFEFKPNSSMYWKCPGCKVQTNFIAAIKSPTCLKCGTEKIETMHIRNLLVICIREIQNMALLGWSKCDNGDSCGIVTRQVSVKASGTHCIKMDCVGGRLHPLTYTSKDIHQHLVYLRDLCKKYRPEAADIAEEAISANVYDTVCLSALFANFAIRGA